MVTFTLVPFRLSDNPRERLHVYVVFAETRHREEENPTKVTPIESASLLDNG